jgi:FkbM family methyltransferase
MKQELLLKLHWAGRQMMTRLKPARPVLSPLIRIGRKAIEGLVRLKYPPGTLIPAEQNGRVWQLDPEVALRGPVQEIDTIEWLRASVKPGMTVIDVGANVGQMTLEMCELVGASGRVVSIEPADGNLRLLRRHVEGNGFVGRTEIITAACSDEHRGSVTFFVFGDDERAVGSGHTVVPGTHPHLARLATTVPTVSIDGLCADRSICPGVVKIDVEGGELKVLEGATKTLAEARPKVRIGFHPFAFEDPALASDRLRALLRDHRYVLDGPAEGPLDLAEYNASPL